MSEEFGSELDGKVAIITGTSSGIGNATTESLTSRGVSVAVTARREGELEELTVTIKDDDGGVLVVPTDITADDGIDTFVETMLDEHGRINILIDNAGLMSLAHIGEVDRETLQTIIDVSLTGLIALAHAVVPTMMEQESGHVVNLSSVVGRFLQTNSSRYNVARAGVKMFSDSLQLDIVEVDIYVLSVGPGMVDMELLDHTPDEGVQKGAEDCVGTIDALALGNIARTITFVVIQPKRININEVLIHSFDQVQP